MAKLMPLTLSNLTHLEGGVVDSQFAHMLAGILNDIKDRPGVENHRKLTLEFEFWPEGHAPQGKLLEVADGVSMSVKFKSSIPAFCSRQFDLALGQRSALFNPDSPDMKPTIFDEEDLENKDRS